jgi:hypothetical protein
MRTFVRVLFAAAVAVVLTAPLTAQIPEAPGAPEAVDPFYVDPSAPDMMPESPQATFFSYFHVIGASMTPRDAGITTAYDGLGCAHMSTTGGFATFPVTIPDGSLIKYVRLYFCDTNAGDVTAFMTNYNPPGVSFTDLVSVASGSAAGCGTVLSTELTYTVSNLDALAVLVTGSAVDRQYCGIRIAYYEP